MSKHPDKSENPVQTQDSDSEELPAKKQGSRKAGKSSKKSKKRRPKKSGKKSGGPGGAGPRPFPAETLEEAARIPKLIRELNGGNPGPPAELAGALGLAPKANRMWYLSASSRD